jgi:hypothetical protein
MSRISSLLLLTLLCSLFGPLLAFAGPREVLLEWEPDPEAVTYELEIGDLKKAKPSKAVGALKATEWTGALEAGKYWMRVRGRDDRGVPGDWSEKVEFQVTLQPVDIIQPKADEVVKADDDKEEIELKWQPMPAATGYSVTVTDESGKVVANQETKETSLEIELPSAMKYSWNVRAIDRTGTPGAVPEKAPSFVLLGEKLEEPEIKSPESSFVRRVDLETPKLAEAVKVEVLRFEPAQKKWVKVASQELQKTAGVPFKQEWPGGEYKLRAVAQAKYRAPSSISEIKFDVEEGDRGVEAEHRAILRKVIERTNDWYFTASYIVSMVSYQAVVNEVNQNSKFDTFTGTGLLGVGKFWKKSPWGFYTSIDYGGMTVEPDGTKLRGEQKITNFLGFESAVVYRWAFGRSDARVRLGSFRQQVPELRLTPTGTGPASTTCTSSAHCIAEMEVFDTIGASFGAEYLYSLSPKFVLQANLSGRVPMVGKSTVSGNKIDPNINYTAGLTGGMRLKQNMTGLAGVSYRKQYYSFKNTTNKTNEILMEGPYLQLILEHDF